ncbi:MAG: hypothetical protein H6855_00760 [Rhodospirillales bacterium]|nr:hypothetical protein [Rhodospirillales bacterium]MCB9964599.1 hypothetical protein [Rhodospirillales bacterium]
MAGETIKKVAAAAFAVSSMVSGPVSANQNQQAETTYTVQDAVRILVGRAAPEMAPSSKTTLVNYIVDSAQAMQKKAAFGCAGLAILFRSASAAEADYAAVGIVMDTEDGTLQFGTSAEKGHPTIEKAKRQIEESPGDVTTHKISDTELVQKKADAFCWIFRGMQSSLTLQYTLP